MITDFRIFLVYRLLKIKNLIELVHPCFFTNESISYFTFEVVFYNAQLWQNWFLQQFVQRKEFLKWCENKARLLFSPDETPAISKYDYLRILRDFDIRMATIAVFRSSMMKPSLCRFASTVNSAIFQKYGNPATVLRYYEYWKLVTL